MKRRKRSKGKEEETYWPASVASETLIGVTQSKIGDVYLFIGERAKRARHSQG